MSNEPIQQEVTTLLRQRAELIKEFGMQFVLFIDQLTALDERIAIKQRETITTTASSVILAAIDKYIPKPEGHDQ